VCANRVMSLFFFEYRETLVVIVKSGSQAGVFVNGADGGLLKKAGETGYWGMSEASDMRSMFLRSSFDGPRWCSSRITN
jgi:hypothetical protein